MKPSKKYMGRSPATILPPANPRTPAAPLALLPYRLKKPLLSARRPNSPTPAMRAFLFRTVDTESGSEHEASERVNFPRFSSGTLLLRNIGGPGGWTQGMRRPKLLGCWMELGSGMRAT